MKISNIPLNRAFGAIELDFDTAKRTSDMSKAIAPVREKIDNLHTDYYDDVWCHVYEKGDADGAGLAGYVVPYEDYLFHGGASDYSIEIPFQKYKNFNATKFYKDIKEATEKVYEYTINQ